MKIKRFDKPTWTPLSMATSAKSMADNAILLPSFATAEAVAPRYLFSLDRFVLLGFSQQKELHTGAIDSRPFSRTQRHIPMCVLGW